MRRSYYPRRTQQGFTLIEVALSLGITAFALVSIMGMFPIGVANFRMARQATFYSEMIQTLQSEVETTKFTTLQATTSPIIINFDGEGNSLPSATGAIYQAEAVPVSPTNGLNSSLQSSPTNVIYFNFELIYVPAVSSGNSILRQFPYTVGNSGN